MDFSKFDKEVDIKKLQKDINAAAENSAGDYKSVPAGVYSGKFERLEVGSTKDDRPMLRAMFRIIGDGDLNNCEYTKYCVFMNRVLYGTQNDANMIASAVGWLKTLDSGIDVEFTGYKDFADLVLDIHEEIAGKEYCITYDPEAFNNISIDAVFADDDEG